MQLERDFIDRLHVGTLDHAAEIDVAELRDLALQLLRQRSLGTANENVRLDSDLHELADGVLGRLRLQFGGRRDEWNQREMNEEGVVAADFLAELTDGFEERQRLDVAHRPADLRDDHIVIRCEPADRALDLVGDMRNHLHRRAEVLAATFLGDHGEIDPSRRHVIHLRQRPVDEPLVVTEIEIGLRAVIGDVDFAVLEGRHRPRIDVDVGIEFLGRNLEPALGEQPAERGGRNALAERADHAAGHEDVFRRAHGLTSLIWRVNSASAHERSAGVSIPGAAGPSNNVTPMGIPCSKGRSCSSLSHCSSGTGANSTQRSRASRVYA